MKTSQKGSSTVLLALIVLLAVIVIGVFIYYQNQSSVQTQPQPVSATTGTQTQTHPTTSVAKPSSPSPSTTKPSSTPTTPTVVNGQTYINSTYHFALQVPAELSASAVVSGASVPCVTDATGKVGPQGCVSVPVEGQSYLPQATINFPAKTTTTPTHVSLRITIFPNNQKLLVNNWYLGYVAGILAHGPLGNNSLANQTTAPVAGTAALVANESCCQSTTYTAYIPRGNQIIGISLGNALYTNVQTQLLQVLSTFRFTAN